MEDEIGTLRLQRSEKETQATKLRHKANTPSLDQMKQQAAASIERNLAQVKELQTIAQRVQQGDPDYLKDGETRDSKIAELASKLSALKRQHQQLLQQQKDLDFDPRELADQAARLESEALEFDSRIRDLEGRRFEAERQRDEQSRLCSRDSELARSVQDRRSSLSSRLAAAEAEAKSQLASLQPLIQEQHAGWQRLIAQQKRLDSDHAQLGSRLEEAERVAEMEASMRSDLAFRIEELTLTLHGLRSFLDEVSGDPAPRSMPQASSSSASAPSSEAPPLLVSAEALLEASATPHVFEVPEILAVVAAPVSLPAPVPPSATDAGLLGDDDFDAFLREDTAKPVAAPTPGGSSLPVDTATTGETDGDLLADEL